MKYICELCGTVYDEELGYPRQGIAPGTPFEKLPVYYHCPGCGCEKEAFTPLKDPAASTPIQQAEASGQYVKYAEPNRESQR